MSKTKAAVFFSALYLMHAAHADTDTLEVNIQEDCGETPAPHRGSVRHIEGKGVGDSKGYTTAEPFLSPSKDLTSSLAPFLNLREHVFNDDKPVVNEDCGETPAPHRGSVRHIEGKGVGYSKGYTTAELFLSPSKDLNSSLIPFLDLRAHVFNDGRPAVNVGGGLRFLASSRIWGINSYYDYRKTSHMNYNQVALGIENLGIRWDFRLNGYRPVGKQSSHLFHHHFHHFTGHELWIQRKKEFAMKGLNAEAGIHFKKRKNIDFYGAFGPYAFWSRGKNAIGGEARLSGTFWNTLKLDVSGSYDPVFKGIFQGQIGLGFTFGEKKQLQPRTNKSCASEQSLRQRTLQPVDRNEIIVAHRKKYRHRPINPLTGLPYFVVHVNSNSSSLGTFESPYPTLADAQANSKPGDLIYLFDGSYDVGTGFVMQDNQKLLGAGINQHIATTQGNITIPAFSANMPPVTSTTADSSLITMANNCEVGGLHLFGQTIRAGIVGVGPGNSSITHGIVRDNFINVKNTGGDCAGIQIFGEKNFLIAGNTVTAFADGNSWGIVVGAVDGQSIGANSSLEAQIVNNTVNAFAVGDLAFGITVGTAFATDPATISGNAAITGLISNNTLTSAAGLTAFGITVGAASPNADSTISGDATITSQIANNTLTSSADTAAFGITTGAASPFSSVTISDNAAIMGQIENNTVTASSASSPNQPVFGIITGVVSLNAITMSDNVAITGLISNNKVFTPGPSAYGITTGAAAFSAITMSDNIAITGSVSNNAIVSFGSNAVYGITTGASSFSGDITMNENVAITGHISNNTVCSSGDILYGITTGAATTTAAIEISDNVAIFGRISNNTINNSGGTRVFGITTGAAAFGTITISENVAITDQILNNTIFASSNNPIFGITTGAASSSDAIIRDNAAIISRITNNTVTATSFDNVSGITVGAASSSFAVVINDVTINALILNNTVTASTRLVGIGTTAGAASASTAMVSDNVAITGRIADNTVTASSAAGLAFGITAGSAAPAPTVDPTVTINVETSNNKVQEIE